MICIRKGCRGKPQSTDAVCSSVRRTVLILASVEGHARSSYKGSANRPSIGLILLSDLQVTADFSPVEDVELAPIKESVFPHPPDDPSTSLNAASACRNWSAWWVRGCEEFVGIDLVSLVGFGRDSLDAPVDLFW